MDYRNFLRLEQQHALFSIRFKEIPIWELIRYEVYAAGSSLQPEARNAKPSIRRAFRKLFVLICYNPFLYRSTTHSLIIRSSRKEFFANQYIDPLTLDFEYQCLGTCCNGHIDLKKNKINRSGKKTFRVYESQYTLHNKGEHVPDIYAITFVSKVLVKRCLPYWQRCLSQQERQYLADISASLSGIFPHVPIDSILNKTLLNFYIERFLYGRLLTIRKPKQLFLTRFNDKMPLVFEAKKRGIEVIEAQHGYTSPSLVLYHFPSMDKNSLLCFPDTFYYLDKLYICQLELPLMPDKIKPYPWTFHKTKIERVRASVTPTEKRSILFVSQNVLYKEMLEFVESYCRLLKNVNINTAVYYKPHPHEYGLLDRNYLQLLDDVYGLKVIGEQEDVYPYLARVQCVVGVFSTLLLEALELKAQVFILKMTGYEHFQRIIDAGMVTLIDSPDNLFKKTTVYL